MLPRIVDALLENPLAYRLWQGPFSGKKLEPVVRLNDLSQVRRVLDVGCGPGTNTEFFRHAHYVGVDINERYTRSAARRYGREFRTLDVTDAAESLPRDFDFVLVNSLMHHLNDDGTHRLLGSLGERLSPNGSIHILDLVLPADPSVARYIAQADRGHYPRPLAAWEQIFFEHFDKEICEPYPLRVFGVAMWQMVYFKGKRRSQAA